MKKELYCSTIDLSYELKEESDGKKILEGQFVKFGATTAGPKSYFDGKYLYHRFEASSFDSIDTTKKIALIFGHDHNQPMAVTTNGSLSISFDEEGGNFRAELADVSYANDAYNLIKDGYLNQMSFGITVDPDGLEIIEEDGKDILLIKKVESLYEISTVLFPAFEESNVAAFDKEFIESLKTKEDDVEEEPKIYKSDIYKKRLELLKIKK